MKSAWFLRRIVVKACAGEQIVGEHLGTVHFLTQKRALYTMTTPTSDPARTNHECRPVIIPDSLVTLSDRILCRPRPSSLYIASGVPDRRRLPFSKVQMSGSDH